MIKLRRAIEAAMEVIFGSVLRHYVRCHEFARLAASFIRKRYQEKLKVVDGSVLYRMEFIDELYFARQGCHLPKSVMDRGIISFYHSWLESTDDGYVIDVHPNLWFEADGARYIIGRYSLVSKPNGASVRYVPDAKVCKIGEEVLLYYPADSSLDVQEIVHVWGQADDDVRRPMFFRPR